MRTLSTKEKKRLFSKYGDWAIVTGASSGIGLEIALQLANAGFNLILNSRFLDQLEEVGNKIKEQAKVKIILVAADLSESAAIEKIIEAGKGLAIGLLVLSAGFGTSGSFIQSELDSEINMLKVNCEAILKMTHFYSQQFVNQKRGGIILMSSMVSFQGTPYASHYAATKAYVQTLAEGLSEELKEFGVDILAAAPGPVKSKFEERANMNIAVFLSPEQVGIPILKALGRESTVLPGYLSKLLVYSLRTVPRWAKIKIMKQVMGGMTAHQKV